MPVPGLYWADAGSIGPVQARYWQLMACLQGVQGQCKLNTMCVQIKLTLDNLV